MIRRVMIDGVSCAVLDTVNQKERRNERWLTRVQRRSVAVISGALAGIRSTARTTKAVSIIRRERSN